MREEEEEGEKEGKREEKEEGAGRGEIRAEEEEKGRKRIGKEEERRKIKRRSHLLEEVQQQLFVPIRSLAPVAQRLVG